MWRRRAEEDEHLVATAMQQLASQPPSDHSLPDPSFIWWKGQLLRRFEAEREATVPLEVGDNFHLGAAVLGAVALAAGAWDYVPAFSFTSTEIVAVALGAAVLISVVALAAIEAIRER
jgi:hypothetical protein